MSVFLTVSFEHCGTIPSFRDKHIEINPLNLLDKAMDYMVVVRFPSKDQPSYPGKW